ncbi:NADH dehydrogenase [Nannochloropsis gaditana CCMP526]|uniref:NADH dehydrogenase n=1 Tax=Nannochloropsis gaditana (strain CCMP526) TaxID=1093141 RepID=UPI00029F5441|nr:NADH dehydrogenase [Nannochloropsis gaditana CCMP526]EKU22510.1 NADH dehydrogenase [Nannochloropsis gaditana CCMP526]|eukprot:XP_005853852.1 NADH dehydrogenase [Nannochloropsis gaditana CCMP526]
MEDAAMNADTDVGKGLKPLGRRGRTHSRAGACTSFLASVVAFLLADSGTAFMPLRVIKSHTRAVTTPSICMSIESSSSKGLYSALRLSELSRPSRYAPPSIDITLVDRHDRFVFLPLLYELAMGDANEEEVAPRFESLLASTGIRFVQGEVEAIDLAGKCVQVQSQGEATEVSESAVEAPSSGSSKSLAYDKLVLALGSEPMLPPAASLPLSEGSLSPSPSSVMPFYTLRDAHALRRQLMRIDALSSPTLFRTVVVGGGYSGVELAANLATRLGRDKGRVTLVERGYQILGNSPMPVRASAGKRLEEEGVEVMLGVDVVEVDGARVVGCGDAG